MLSLVEQLEQDLKAAALERDAIRLNVVRALKSALKNYQIEVGHDLSSQEMLTIVQKEAKKRHDSIEAYQNASRNDLAQEEQAELTIIDSYLPSQMDDAALNELVSAVIAELDATSMADMGKVMAEATKRVDGQAAAGRISQLVKTKLSS